VAQFDFGADKAMRSAQDKGTFSLGELMRLASGDDEVLTPIIEDAKQRFMNDLESKDYPPS